MPNNKVGSQNVGRHNISIDDADWDTLVSQAKELKAGNPSALIRAFIRLVEKKPEVVKPLLVKLIVENDKIKPKKKVSDYNKLIDKAF